MVLIYKKKKCNSLFYLEGFIESKNLSKEAYLIQGCKRTGNLPSYHRVRVRVEVYPAQVVITV